MISRRPILAALALLLLLAPAGASLAQLIVEGSSRLDLEVVARVTLSDGRAQLVPVKEGHELRTGDGVQIRLRAKQDAYVYVIVYGSSESAVVLHPFSGRRDDAFMRAGEERVLPAPDRFLPLDRRAGTESVYAFASPTPVRLMSSLLVRMEARGGDRRSVAEALRNSYPDALALNFRHADAAVSGARSKPTASAASSSSDQSGSPPPRAFEEPGVLAAEGSRIQAFIEGKPTQQTQVPRSVAITEPVQTRPEPAAQPAQASAPSGESGGWLGRLFGFGGGDNARPDAEPTPTTEAAAATTYALPATPDTKPEPATITADAQSGAAPSPSTQVTASGSESSAIQPSPPATAEGVDPQLNLSALDAVVVSLSESDAEGASAAASPAAEPATSKPSTAASAPANVASGEPPPEAQASSEGGLFGQLFGTSTEPEPEPETTPVAAPEPADPAPSAATDAAPAGVAPSEPPPTASASSEGGLFSRLFGTSAEPESKPEAASAPSRAESSAPTAASAPGSVEPGQASSDPDLASPASASTAAATVDSEAATGQQPVKTVAIGSAEPVEPASPANKTVAIGPADVSAPDPAPDPRAGGTSLSEPETSVADPQPEASQGGFLSGLASLFGGASSNAPESTDSSSPQAEGEAAARERALAEARERELAEARERELAEARERELAEAQQQETPTQASGGLLSGLAGWFTGSSSNESTQEASRTAEASDQTQTAPPSPVVVSPEPARESVVSESTGESQSGGLFGGLGRLFGGTGQEDNAAGTEPGEPAVPQASESAQAPAATDSDSGAGPAFKTVTKADGSKVVIVEGPPGRPGAAPASSEVLAGEGSKIRALLADEPQVAPEDNVVAQVRQQGATPVAPSAAGQPGVAQSAPLRAPAAAPDQQAQVAQASSQMTVTASAQASDAPSVNLSAPAPAGTASVASVEPDEVQAALESGAATARPPAETLAALTAPQPAVEVSVAPVQDIDVNADDNVSSSIVLVVTPTGTGSGVLLDDTGHVLANWHVVNGYTTVSVSFKSPNLGVPSMERTFSARVVRLNKTADLALLRLDAPPGDVTPVRFADSGGIKAGDVLHAIGHPASGAWTHTLGKIDNVKPESSWYAGRNLLHRGTVIQARVLDDPGSAGAPLFNNRLELVGISAVSRTKKGMLTGVSIETIRLFLEAPPAGG